MNEIKPIDNPYPVPSVRTISVEKFDTRQIVGISMNALDTNSVVIVSKISQNGLLHNKNIKIGDEILAINGIAIHTPQQAASIISSNNKLEFLLLDPYNISPNQPPATPFCYVEVAPTTKTNPGVSFDSCCGRSMVIISEIFLSDLNKTRLRYGDIVLAINGKPIWKPEQADIEQIKAAKSGKAVILYCINMKALRDHFTTVCKRTWTDGTGGGGRKRTATIQPLLLSSTLSTNNEFDYDNASNGYLIKERDCNCIGIINTETQLLDDQTEWNDRIKNLGGDHTSKHMYKKISYERICKPTLQNLNELISNQLRILKLRIVGHSWHSAITEQQQEGSNETTPTTYVLPSAPPAMAMEVNNSLRGLNMIPLAEAIPVEPSED